MLMNLMCSSNLMVVFTIFNLNVWIFNLNVWWSVWLVLGPSWMGGSRDETGRQTRRIVSCSWQFRRSVHFEHKFPLARCHSSHSHRALQRFDLTLWFVGFTTSSYSCVQLKLLRVNPFRNLSLVELSISDRCYDGVSSSSRSKLHHDSQHNHCI